MTNSYVLMPPAAAAEPDRSAASADLIEREPLLLALEQQLRNAARGSGRTVLVSGEAGIGKTSLLRAFAARKGGARLWWGACDALETPHPLAPLQDIARSADVGFGSLLNNGTRRAELFEAVLAELLQSAVPVVVVMEDIHWADDATLDLLKFLGRRIDQVSCLLIVTYRDDQMPAAHPLRRLVGELPNDRVTPVSLPRLSREGVELLARRALRSPDGAYAATQGNPFFLTEMLRNGMEGVPRSVHDLVLSRFARLSPAAQAIVKLVSVVPGKAERRLVDTVLAPAVEALEECLNSGLLVTAPGTLCFRHELARAAIEQSLPEPVAQHAHAQVLAFLEQADATTALLARLVHHAARAGDDAAVLRHAPLAAQQAQSRGAHREAAAHYRLALRFARAVGGIDDCERARWLHGYAAECQFTGQMEAAIAARLELSEVCRRTGNAEFHGRNLSQLSLAYTAALRSADAAVASHAAIAMLEALPPGEALASAYRIEAQRRHFMRESDVSIGWGNKSLQLGEQLGDSFVIAAGYTTRGSATLFIDFEAGHADLHRGLSLALAAGESCVAANTYHNLGVGCGETFRLREAREYMALGTAFADLHEIDIYRNYCTAWLALCDMYLGRWDQVSEQALRVLAQQEPCDASRVIALAALGRLRSRRGDPEAAECLDEALAMALRSDSLQLIAPVRAARAEAAYLRGDLAAVAHEAGSALALAKGLHHEWFIGELAYWMQRAGGDDGVPFHCAEPFALQIRGRAREAAAEWARLGCPYEQARALCEGDASAQLEAFKIFEGLGARPAAEALKRRWRSEGRRGLPRGMRASTQTNPHQLTTREIEVLLLLCEGLRNADIAQRLYRSVRTVDHHLASVFAKLGVTSRTEAVAAAMRNGILAQSRQGEEAI